jgi:hypothetical protein
MKDITQFVWRFKALLLSMALVFQLAKPAIAQHEPAQPLAPAHSSTSATPQGNNWPAPMVHQVWDTADEFNGYWACGPTSAVMALAYYQKIPPRAITINSGGVHTNDYGFYVSNIYEANGRRFDTSKPDASGRLAYGAYGQTIGWYCDGYCSGMEPIRNYIRAHGLEAETSNRSSTTTQQDLDYVKEQIDRGYLVIASGTFNGLGHIVLIRGYTDDGRFILNDPYGDPNSPGTYGRTRNGENVTIGFGNNLRFIKWMVVVKGTRAGNNRAVETDNQLLTVGASFNSTIAPNNDDDTFWFDGAAGANIKITMNATSSAIDTFLTLYAPDGRELARNDDANNSTNSEIRAALPTAGRYRFVAGSYNRASGGNYTVAVSQINTPNVEMDDQRWLAFGAPLAGAITPMTDRDTYYFSGSAGTVVNIRMNKANTTLDSWLELYSPSGTFLAYNDDGGGDLNSWLAYRLPVNGTYRIIARSYNLSSNGPYQIRVATDRNNFALGVDADASSVGTPLDDATLATDGSQATAWVSGEAMSQTLRIDLGAVKRLDQAVIRWGEGYATAYGIYYQDAANRWQPLFATQSGDGDVDILGFPAVQARYVTLALWGRPDLTNGYTIREFELHDTSSVLIPLVPPDDMTKPEETNVMPLIPLAPEPDGKAAQPFALGADQESFPLADGDGASHAPQLQITDSYRFPTTTLQIGATTLWSGTTITATAINAHDQDTNQQGSGIVAYRWALIQRSIGPSGNLVIPVGEQATVEITDTAKLEPGDYLLTLQVQDDEGSWSAPVAQTITIPAKLFLPVAVR